MEMAEVKVFRGVQEMRQPATGIIRPPNLSVSDLVAFFTTRNTEEMYFEGFKKRFFPIQKHTNRVHILDDPDDSVVADAVITHKNGILIGIRVADCVPILLYDRKRRIIGAVHAGWRGTAKGIIGNSISLMCERFGSVPDEIMIAMGPSIRGCCYEVGFEIVRSIKEITGGDDYYRVADRAFYLDLPRANIVQAISAGVSEENIWCSEECTCCNPDRFYSYRCSGGGAGRQGGFIGMW